MIRIVVDGIEHTADPLGPESLLTTLHDRLGLTGTKGACEQGECGSCSVIMDGDLVCSCLVMAVDADGAEIRTIEGMAAGGVRNAVQEAMLAAGGVQCGFCTPGIVVAATHHLEHHPGASEEEIREALAGNICRCTGYGAILRALADLHRGQR